MERQPFQFMIVAWAHRRDLPADTERVRPRTQARPGRRAYRGTATRLRLAAGGALIRAGHRLLGTPAAPGQPGVTAEAH